MAKFHQSLIKIKTTEIPDLEILDLIGIATGKRAYGDIHDAFIVKRLSAWADTISGQACTRHKWAGNIETLLFNIKSEFTSNKDVKPGFQICPYAKSEALIDAVERELVPIADGIFHFKGEKKKGIWPYFHWDFPTGSVPINQILTVIEKLVEYIDECDKK